MKEAEHLVRKQTKQKNNNNVKTLAEYIKLQTTARISFVAQANATF